MSSGQCGWKCTMVILQVGQSTQIKLLPILSKWRGQKQWCSPAPLVQRIPTAPGEFLQFHSLLYLVSFSWLLLRNCLFSPQLSLRSKCSLYMHIFHFAHGRGQVQCPPTPLPFGPLSVIPFKLGALHFLSHSSTVGNFADCPELSFHGVKKVEDTVPFLKSGSYELILTPLKICLVLTPYT